VIRLLGGADPHKRRRGRPWWHRLGFSLARFLGRLPLTSALLRIGHLVGGALLLLVMPIRHPRATLRGLVAAAGLRVRGARLTISAARDRIDSRLRAWGRRRAKTLYDLVFSPRVDWRVGRVRLTPGTLYRVRRQHVSDTFACLGANGIAIDDYVGQFEREAVPGPWNNNF